MKCYSRGNINAPIMIIAEAPAKEELGHEIEEIKMPIPLCGPAGRLLHGMLNWADINEGDFILTNIIKNGIFSGNRVRPPTEKELLDNRRETLREILKINPKLIITLGKSPLWTLCYHDKIPYDEMTIGKHNGVIHELEYQIIEVLNPDEMLIYESTTKLKKKLLPLYHPSAILRDTDNKNGYKKKVAEAMKNHKEMISDILGRILL